MIASKKKLSTNPLKTTLLYFKLPCFLVFSIVSLNATIGYCLAVWVPTYVTTLVSSEYLIPKTTAGILNSVTILVISLLIPVFGLAADKYGKYKVLAIGSVLTTVVLIPIFAVLEKPTVLILGISEIVLLVPFCIYASAMGAWMALTFPPEVRYSAVAIGYNVAQATFGGSIALVSTALYQQFHNPISVGIYLTAVAMLSNFSLWYSYRYIYKPTQPANVLERRLLLPGTYTLHDNI